MWLKRNGCRQAQEDWLSISMLDHSSFRRWCDSVLEGGVIVGARHAAASVSETATGFSIFTNYLLLSSVPRE